jgi:hypothetical protein
MPDRFEFDERGMRETFQSRSGPVGDDLSRRGTRVQLAARKQVGKDTHMLERTIVKRWGRSSGVGIGRGDLVISVGSDRWYALLHHEGTRRHTIRPRNPGGVLRFVKDGRVIFARSVNHPGTRPNKYLSDSLPLAVAD